MPYTSISSWSSAKNTPSSSAPAVKPPENFRLPGPHYVLENALVQRETDQDARDREKQRNISAADLWFRSKKRSREESPAIMTPPMIRAPEGGEVIITLPVNGAPEIPIWLAEARGCDPLPDTPPQDGSSTADAQAWMASQSGVGLGLSNAYLFDGSWSMPPQQADYDMVLGDPYGHSAPTTLLYERARGSASAAIPPAMHAGGGGGGGHEKSVYYSRNGGPLLPYPQHLNDFAG